MVKGWGGVENIGDRRPSTTTKNVQKREKEGDQKFGHNKNIEIRYFENGYIPNKSLLNWRGVYWIQPPSRTPYSHGRLPLRLSGTINMWWTDAVKPPFISFSVFRERQAAPSRSSDREIRERGGLRFRRQTRRPEKLREKRHLCMTEHGYLGFNH